MKKILFALLLAVAGIASAQQSGRVFQWQVLKVVDGDTIAVNPGFLPQELDLKVRVKGVDTPEKGGRAACPSEAALALKASAFTKSLVEDAIRTGKPILFGNIEWDKFGGRVLADVQIGNVILSQALIQQGLARPYFGEKKQSWCN